MKKQFYLKSLLSLLLLFVGMNVWAQTDGNIQFGSNIGSIKINSKNVTGTDSQNNNWNIITEGTSSFTQNPSYSQIGSSKNSATSITFTMNLSTEQTFNAVSANFGGFNSTAGNVTIAVGETSVATGSLNGGNDVTVSASNIAVKGNVLKITVTDISRGVKVYKISYTLETPETATASPTLTEGGEFQVSKQITITDNAQGANIYYTTDGNDPTADSNEYTGPFTISATTTVKAIAIKDGISSTISSATYTRTYLDAGLSWSAGAKSVTLASLTPSDLPTLNNPNNLDIVYSTTNEERAKFVNGVLTLIDGANNTGSVTIKANTAGNETYAAGEAAYTLTIRLADSNVAWTTSTGITDLSDATFTQPTTTTAENYDGTVTYASNNTDVAEFNANKGVITVKGKGIAVITATAPQTNRFKESTATYTLTVTDKANSDVYTLVTDASTLQAGDVITFVYNNVAIGTQQENNFAKTDISITGNTFIAPDDLSSFTLEGAVDAWYFKNVNGEYLYAASSEKNYLQTQLNKDDNSKATITISATNDATIKFQGSNSRNSLRYNTSASVFSCYSTGQRTVNIYRKVTPAAENTTITISPALYGTYYNSQKAYTMPDDCEGYVFTSENKLEKMYEPNTVVPAGEPLVIYSIEAGIKTLNFTTSNDETYKQNDMNALDGVDVETLLEADANSYFYGLSLNAQSELNSVGFYWVNDGGAAFTVPAHKAYLKVAKQSGAKSFFLFNDGEVTGINSVNAIDETAPVYNVQGQRVVASTKGIVIQNGRKFFNK